MGDANYWKQLATNHNLEFRNNNSQLENFFTSRGSLSSMEPTHPSEGWEVGSGEKVETVQCQK